MPQRMAVELAIHQEEEGGSDFEGAFQVTTSIPCKDLESSGCSRENIGKYFFNISLVIFKIYRGNCKPGKFLDLSCESYKWKLIWSGYFYDFILCTGEKTDRLIEALFTGGREDDEPGDEELLAYFQSLLENGVPYIGRYFILFWNICYRSLAFYL